MLVTLFPTAIREVDKRVARAVREKRVVAKIYRAGAEDLSDHIIAPEKYTKATDHIMEQIELCKNWRKRIYLYH